MYNKKYYHFNGQTMSYEDLVEARKRNKPGQGNAYWRWHSKENKPRGLGALMKVIRWDVLRMYQKDFGDLFDPRMSQRAISDLENGKYQPSRKVLDKALTLLVEELQKVKPK